MKNKIDVLSAQCVGGYNDTLIYNVTINYKGKEEIVLLERHYHDMQKTNETWDMCTFLELTDSEKNKIINVVSKNPPSIFSDAPPQIYNNESNNLDLLDEIEM